MRGIVGEKDRYVKVYKGLLTPEHCQRMGPAIWEFLWCIDRVTREDQDGTGIVLKGDPISLHRISEELGEALRSVERHISTLRRYGYIETERDQYGVRIRVPKCRKFDVRTAKNGGTEPEAEPPKSAGLEASEPPKMVLSPAKGGGSPIDSTLSTNSGVHEKQEDKRKDIRGTRRPSSDAAPTAVEQDLIDHFFQGQTRRLKAKPRDFNGGHVRNRVRVLLKAGDAPEFIKRVMDEFFASDQNLYANTGWRASIFFQNYDGIAARLRSIDEKRAEKQKTVRYVNTGQAAKDRETLERTMKQTAQRSAAIARQLRQKGETS